MSLQVRVMSGQLKSKPGQVDYHKNIVSHSGHYAHMFDTVHVYPWNELA